MEIPDKKSCQPRVIEKLRLIPHSFPEIPGYSVSGKILTASDLGGDCMDCFLLPDGRMSVSGGPPIQTFLAKAGHCWEVKSHKYFLDSMRDLHARSCQSSRLMLLYF